MTELPEMKPPDEHSVLDYKNGDSRAILFAPMEGVVNWHIREIYRKLGGVCASVTEFVRVTDHLLPDKVFHRYAPELRQGNELMPTRIQLLGSEPKALAANAKQAIELGSPGIDLNFGCPAKSVNRHRGGACLLAEPELIYSIVAAVRDAVDPAHPVSVKIRLGYTTRDMGLSVAQAAERAGANELVVHARSKADGYKPPAYWQLLRPLSNELRIPVIANGDIFSLEDYQKCVADSGCAQVMLGRGLLARPDLARRIQLHRTKTFVSKVDDDGEDPTLSWSELVPILQQFFNDTYPLFPARFCGNRLKQWLAYLQNGYPEAKDLFNRIKRLKTPREINACLIPRRQ